MVSANKSQIFSVLLACVAFSSSGCRAKTHAISYRPAPASWQVFASKECGFSVAFPSEPRSSSETYTNAGRIIELRQFITELNKTTAFGVSVATIPVTNGFSSKQIEILLDSGRNSALRTKGEPNLLRERQIVFNANPGREFDMEIFNGRMFVRVREYLVGKRVYTLTATVSSAKSNPQEISSFLDSFQLDQ